MRDQLKPETGQPPAVPAQRRPSTGGADVDGGEEPAGVAWRVADRLAYLDAATRRINSALDLATTLRNLCRVLVPALADAAVVHLREPLPDLERDPGRPTHLRIQHSHGTRLGRRAGAGTGTAVAPDGALARAMLGGAPAGPAVLGTRADAGIRPLLRELYGARTLGRLGAGTSVLALPLRGRQAVLGLLVLIRRPPRGRRPDRRPDRRRARPVRRRRHRDRRPARHPRRARHRQGGAVRPRGVHRRRAAAHDAARARCRSRTGVRLASRYLPAAETARVGGDWYDAIPLPGSRVALVVGDVMGHSMTSAAIMGQLRTTAQTLAGLDLPPQEVLHHLDEQAQRLGHATAWRPACTRSTTRSRTGSPSPTPAIRRPCCCTWAAGPRCCGCPPGAPIGVGGVDFEAVELDAPAGATLLLYTDGLVESAAARRLDRHRAAARARSPRPRQLTGPTTRRRWRRCATRCWTCSARATADDDIALLAARFDGIAPSDVAYWFLEPEDAAPGRARRLARQRPAPLGPGGPDRLGGAAGQRGRDQRRAVRRAAGDAAAAADRRAALRGRRRRAAAAPPAPGAGHGRGRARDCTW